MPGVSDDTVLQVSTSRGVATLTLDSPANRNALSRATRAQSRPALAGGRAGGAGRAGVSPPLPLPPPPSRAALPRARRARLRTAVAGALADGAVRVVVLAHTGRV